MLPVSDVELRVLEAKSNQVIPSFEPRKVADEDAPKIVLAEL